MLGLEFGLSLGLRVRLGGWTNVIGGHLTGTFVGIFFQGEAGGCPRKRYGGG